MRILKFPSRNLQKSTPSAGISRRETGGLPSTNEPLGISLRPYRGLWAGLCRTRKTRQTNLESTRKALPASEPVANPMGIAPSTGNGIYGKGIRSKTPPGGGPGGHL